MQTRLARCLTMQIRRQTAFSECRRSLCDKASPGVAVMLHLRSRYVSKAAILTLPVRSVAVEKSKFHLNSKGLDR
jgi:hypothetical protein